jgi:hypothetical protein
MHQRAPSETQYHATTTNMQLSALKSVTNNPTVLLKRRQTPFKYILISCWSDLNRWRQRLDGLRDKRPRGRKLSWSRRNPHSLTGKLFFEKMRDRIGTMIEFWEHRFVTIRFQRIKLELISERIQCSWNARLIRRWPRDSVSISQNGIKTNRFLPVVRHLNRSKHSAHKSSLESRLWIIQSGFQSVNDGKLYRSTIGSRSLILDPVWSCLASCSMAHQVAHQVSPIVSHLPILSNLHCLWHVGIPIHRILSAPNDPTLPSRSAWFLILSVLMFPLFVTTLSVSRTNASQLKRFFLIGKARMGSIIL